MRLSEAIRLGTMLGPQAHGTFERKRRKYIFFGPVVRELCALGAAYAAGGGGSHLETVIEDQLAFRGSMKAGETVEVMDTPPDWTRVMHSSITCPQCGGVKLGKQLISHLNDDHRWMREHIARFVEQVETQLGISDGTELVADYAVDPVVGAQHFTITRG